MVGDLRHHATHWRYGNTVCPLYGLYSTIHLKISVNASTLQWHHKEHDGVSNHQSHDYLLNRLCRRKSKKILKLHVTGLCGGNSPVTGDSPHKGSVAWKMCPFDDVIMGFVGFLVWFVARWYYLYPSGAIIRLPQCMWSHTEGQG